MEVNEIHHPSGVLEYIFKGASCSLVVEVSAESRSALSIDNQGRHRLSIGFRSPLDRAPGGRLEATTRAWRKFDQGSPLYGEVSEFHALEEAAILAALDRRREGK